MFIRRFINKESLPRIKVILNAKYNIESGIYFNENGDEKINILNKDGIVNGVLELDIYNENNIFFNTLYDDDHYFIDDFTGFTSIDIGEGFEHIELYFTNDVDINLPNNIKTLKFDSSKSIKINSLTINNSIESFIIDSGYSFNIDNFYYDNNNITRLSNLYSTNAEISNNVINLPGYFPFSQNTIIPNSVKNYLPNSLYNYIDENLELDNVILSKDVASGNKNIKTITCKNINILPYESLHTYIGANIVLENVKYLCNDVINEPNSITLPETLLLIGELDINNYNSNLILPINLKYCSNLCNIHTDVLTFNCKNLNVIQYYNSVNNNIFTINEELIIGDQVEYINVGFKGNVKNVILSENIKEIGDYVFNNCIHLTNVTLPESVTKVGVNCFPDKTNVTILGELEDYSNIKNIVGMEVIDGCYYYNNELFRVDDISVINVKEGCIRITANLNVSNLTTINIPDSVIYIKKQSFSNDVEININENNKYYSIYNTKNTIVNIENKEIIAIYEKNPIIPEIAERFIDNLFDNTNDIYNSLTIPNTIKYIGKQKFAYNTIIINSTANLDNVTLKCSNLHIIENNYSYFIDILYVCDNFTYSGTNNIIGINNVIYENVNTIISNKVGKVIITLNDLERVDNVTQIYGYASKEGSNILKVYNSIALTKVKLPNYIDIIDFHTDYGNILADFMQIEFVDPSKDLTIMFAGSIVKKISIDGNTAMETGDIRNFIHTQSPILDKNIIIPYNITKCSLCFIGDLTVDLTGINENIDMSESKIYASMVTGAGTIKYSAPTILINDKFLKLKKLPIINLSNTNVLFIYNDTVSNCDKAISDNEDFIKTMLIYNNDDFRIIFECTDGTIYL